MKLRTLAAAATLIVLAVSGCSSSPDTSEDKPRPAGASPSASSLGDLVVPDPTGTASKAAREAAAKILRASNDHYRSLLDEGRNAWGTPDFGSWQSKALNDLSYLDAFRKADGHFDATNEPAGIRNWQSDIAAVGDAINQWAQQNTLDTAQKSAMPEPKDVTTALGKCDSDVRAVLAGK
ncbi:hypothetical protein ACFYXS_00590 [Streptomyces sp. NPDC002574]|uniref:hypothetical protein n=1 Tax=Streptomyces sp. NPDC002574 TaxID=3364652 RepID=UPI0036C37619